MTYVIQDWQNAPSTATPILADEGAGSPSLDHMEAGISGAHYDATHDASADGTVAAVFRGHSPTQSGDLSQWVTNTNTVLSRMTKDGAFAAALQNAAAVAVTLKLAAGASADALQVQTSTGVTTGRFTKDGGVAVALQNAAAVAASWKGAAGQTGDLSQWQLSTGTVAARVTKDGLISAEGSAGGFQQKNAATFYINQYYAVAAGTKVIQTTQQGDVVIGPNLLNNIMGGVTDSRQDVWDLVYTAQGQKLKFRSWIVREVGDSVDSQRGRAGAATLRDFSGNPTSQPNPYGPLLGGTSGDVIYRDYAVTYINPYGAAAGSPGGYWLYPDESVAEERVVLEENPYELGMAGSQIHKVGARYEWYTAPIGGTGIWSGSTANRQLRMMLRHDGQLVLLQFPADDGTALGNRGAGDIVTAGDVHARRWTTSTNGNEVRMGGVGPNAALTTNINVSNGDVVWTAADTTAAGSLVTIRYKHPDTANAALSVTTSGSDVTVNLATDANAKITSTASQIVAKVNGATTGGGGASNILTGAVVGTGAGVVRTMTKHYLIGAGGISAGSAGDTNLYRVAANQWQTDDQLIAVDGVATKVHAGAVTDANFTVTPVSGMLAVDTTNSKLYVRVGSTWKSVTVA